MKWPRHANCCALGLHADPHQQQCRLTIPSSQTPAPKPCIPTPWGVKELGSKCGDAGFGGKTLRNSFTPQPLNPSQASMSPYQATEQLWHGNTMGSM